MTERLSDDEGRAFLDLRGDDPLPGREELVQDARAIIQSNLACQQEVAAKGIGISPIWEDRDGVAVVRATVLPEEFQDRYFRGGGLEVISKPSVLAMVADLVPWMTDDPAGAAMALEDTHRLWCTDGAPVRSLETPYRAHFKVLSLLLADIARKGDGGLNTVEWFASLGLPLEDFRDASDPPAQEIKQAMRQRMQEMWDEEGAWMEKALR